MASLGVSHRASATAATVGTSAAVLVPGNPTRKSVTIINVDTTATDYVWIGGDDDVTTSNGLRVAGTGGSIRLDDYVGPVWAIATTTSTPVRILEVG